jgi:hypothetical protein
MTNYLYVVYDKIQGTGENITTATVSFDVVGGLTAQRVHCEGTGVEFLTSYGGPKSRWRDCVTSGGNETKYVTSFRLTPGN